MILKITILLLCLISIEAKDDPPTYEDVDLDEIDLEIAN